MKIKLKKCLVIVFILSLLSVFCINTNSLASQVNDKDKVWYFYSVRYEKDFGKIVYYYYKIDDDGGACICNIKSVSLTNDTSNRSNIECLYIPAYVYTYNNKYIHPVRAICSTPNFTSQFPGLKCIKLPRTLKYISKDAFNDVGKMEVDILGDVNIEEGAFSPSTMVFCPISMVKKFQV